MGFLKVSGNCLYVWRTYICFSYREKRATMAEIVEQVQEREAAHVRHILYIFSLCFQCFVTDWCNFFVLTDLARHVESLIVLLAVSQHPWLVLMDVLGLETVPNLGGVLVQRNQRELAVLAQPLLRVPQQHPSHLLTQLKMKASSTVKRPPALTLKLNKGAPTGTLIFNNKIFIFFLLIFYLDR